VKRLLLDEHVAQLYREQLRRRDPAPTVWQIGDEGAPPKGTLDPELLLWCEANDYSLVTSNRASMLRHLRDVAQFLELALETLGAVAKLEIELLEA